MRGLARQTDAAKSLWGGGETEKEREMWKETDYCTHKKMRNVLL